VDPYGDDDPVNGQYGPDPYGPGPRREEAFLPHDPYRADPFEGQVFDDDPYQPVGPNAVPRPDRAYAAERVRRPDPFLDEEAVPPGAGPYGNGSYDGVGNGSYGNGTHVDASYGDAPYGNGSYGNGSPVDGSEGSLGGPPPEPRRLMLEGDGAGGDGPDYDDYFDDDEEDIELEDVTSSVTRNVLEWAVVLVGAVLVALVLRASLFQAFFIPSESMETTLLIDDRVLVNKLSYRLHDVNRGDIVVFERPDDEPAEIRDLIKRVIGLPGETIEAKDNSIYINGNRLIEPYLDEGTITTDFPPTVVSEGHVFVMGDNREQSYDSRIFGAIPEDRVVGRAFALFWPLNRVSSL
jgi:signal peptidase I